MIIPKDPDGVLDYSFDWTDWLAGDEILTSDMIVPAGLTKDGEEHITAIATVWLSGGTAGTSYTATNRITTVGGRTDDRSITVRVKER